IQGFKSNARGLARLGVDMREVRQMDRGFLVHDTALLRLRLALMTLDDIDAGDQGTIFLRENLQDFALLALVATGRDDDLVALLDVAHHRTSGASEMIFIWFLARSSRVTGPKMRVPIGSPWALTSTAALPSKRIKLPSGRRTPLAVRTTTALSTSPFLTRPRGIASFTDTTMMSPTSA